MRSLFVESLASAGMVSDYSSITTRKGMLSFSGLSEQQVHARRDEHSIYIVDSGRINVAGMTEANMPRLCAAINRFCTFTRHR